MSQQLQTSSGSSIARHLLWLLAQHQVPVKHARVSSSDILCSLAARSSVRCKICSTGEARQCSVERPAHSAVAVCDIARTVDMTRRPRMRQVLLPRSETDPSNPEPCTPSPEPPG